MEAYKKIASSGKTIHCYGFNKTQSIKMFDPSGCRYPVGKFKPGALSVGVAIEPLYGEYRQRAAYDQPLGLPNNELQENSVCLFFARPESLDAVIETLQDCKKLLREKIAEAAREEYRQKYCGQVIQFSDIPYKKQAAVAVLKTQIGAVST